MLSGGHCPEGSALDSVTSVEYRGMDCSSSSGHADARSIFRIPSSRSQISVMLPRKIESDTLQCTRAGEESAGRM
jgi:hypothetical protein